MKKAEPTAKQLIVHDWGKSLITAPHQKEIAVAKAAIQPCIGCFGCWTKTPAHCVIRDKYSDIGRQFAASGELAIVSRCLYGGFAPQVKNVLDRCIGYLLPFFTIRADKRMHHQSRYKQRLHLAVHFYGDATEEEMETARQLVERNAINLNAESHQVEFHRDTAGMEGWLV